jgi:hypothetical protein
MRKAVGAVILSCSTSLPLFSGQISSCFDCSAQIKTGV